MRRVNWNVIYAQTRDYCAIWTLNPLEVISKMRAYWWTLVEEIPDDESVMLCFAKWDLLSKLTGWKQ